MVAIAAVDSSSAVAQSADVVDIEIPAVVLESRPSQIEEAAAEEDLTQTVLSVAKRVETVEAASSIVTVVTRDTIDVHGYTDLSDLLDEIPGFEGYRPAFYYQSSEAFARGNARTILVLWNGVPINSPQTNRRALGPYLPINALERVEVVSGPGGVLWGANAFLGIVSATPQRELRGDAISAVTATAGASPRASGEYRASAAVADQWLRGRVKLYANLGLVSTRGAILTPPYDLTSGPFPAPDSDGAFQLRPSTGYTHNARDTWMPLTLAADLGPLKIDVLYPVIDRQFREFNDQGLRTDQFVGQDGMLVVGPSSQRAESVTLGSVQLDRDLGKSLHVAARAYYTGFEDRWVRLVKFPAGLLGAEAILVDETYAGMNPYLHDGAYRYGASVDVTRARGWSTTIVGAEAYREGIREVRRSVSGGLAPGDFLLIHPGQRVVTSAFVNEELDVSRRLGLELGARGQYAPGAYAPLVLGSAATRVGLARNVNLKLHAAQGFRPPAFEQTNGNDDARTNPFPHRQSNPDLKAERSLSLESELNARLVADAGGLRWLALRLGYQYTRLDDLIVFGATGEPENANRRIMSSIELRGEAAITGGHRLVVGYGFLTGEDLETGPLRNIPEHRLAVDVEARLARRVGAFLGMVMSGPVEDIDRLPVTSVDGSATAWSSMVVVDRLPASAKLNLGVRASGLMGGHLDLGAYVMNALDSQYPIADPDFERREAIYPMTAPGLDARLTLGWRM